MSLERDAKRIENYKTIALAVGGLVALGAGAIIFLFSHFASADDFEKHKAENAASFKDSNDKFDNVAEHLYWIEGRMSGDHDTPPPPKRQR